ncbi:nicotinamide riboside transporter PnuC [Paenibacillus sp. CF384]|uniref:nicotinamide riboside transporter PnuC n=1 Tax=Paenibacillus sp. CF384 TaxID=1884382 RepID=UPI0008974C9E|nr:nicotinamide riboside transporter PnuC [Paenibacillus sp. CF384]SDW98976.1 nicotinamide mononucleotide transporter [Paenibacillus sp. CF384]
MRRYVGSWNWFELSWLVLFTLIAALFNVLSKDSIFGFTVFITGVLCVVLTAKGMLMSYVFGMYNTVGYAYLAYINGLFGEVMLNLLFFVPMNVVGFYMWRKNLQGGRLSMREMKMKGLLLVGIVCLLGSLLVGFGLSFIKGQNAPYMDALTTVLSVVATILMVRRFKEQWLLYMVLNIFTVLLWIVRTLDGSEDGLMMIIMWSAYLVNAGYGYYIWNRGAKEALA